MDNNTNDIPRDEVLLNDHIDISNTVQALVLERKNAAKQDPTRLLDWDEVSKGL